eukprot:GEMP01007081.1.p1 GENE.GEMP01007081.1~~GEMP01007081.1.p1  ORF type:complete len:855 (+),score=166.04 GEMP01007081.1:176-2740(+)
MKRALCVGCNYPTKATGLNGAVNDAFLISEMLQKRCGFEEANITVLHDVMPGQPKTVPVPPGKIPTRRNILNQLTSLISSAKAGDTLFVSFSGYGLQVDDLDGYQDEGYDEAILPTDFMDGRDGDCTVVVTENLQDAFTNVPKGCSLTVLMDCDHSSTIVDVSGTLDGDLVQGLKYQSLWCGMTTHSTKTELVVHSRAAYSEELPRSLNARPRFHRYMNISNPRIGKSPHRGTMSRARPATFCYGASQFGQTSLELELPKICDGHTTDAKQVHGVLSWCFVRAMAKLEYDCTHSELLKELTHEMETIKWKFAPLMDQQVLFTFTKPAANPQTMRVLQSPAVKDYVCELSKDSMRATRAAARTLMMSKIPSPMSTDSNGIFGEETMTNWPLQTYVGNGSMPGKPAAIDSETSSQTIETASTVPKQLCREMLSPPTTMDQSWAPLPFMASSPTPSSLQNEGEETRKENTADDEVIPAPPGSFNLFSGTSLYNPNIGLRVPSLTSLRSNSTVMTPVRLATAAPLAFTQPALYYPSFFSESTLTAYPATANTISHVASPPRQHSPVINRRTADRRNIISPVGRAGFQLPRQHSPVPNAMTADRRHLLSPDNHAAVPRPRQRRLPIIHTTTDTTRNTTSSTNRTASQLLEHQRISDSTKRTVKPHNTTSPTQNTACQREQQQFSPVMHAMSRIPHNTIGVSNDAAFPQPKQRRSTITNVMTADRDHAPSSKSRAASQHPTHRTIINAVTDLTQTSCSINALSPKFDQLRSPFTGARSDVMHYAAFQQPGQQRPISHAVTDLTQTLPFHNNAFKYPGGCALEGDGGTRTTMCSDGSRFTRSTLTGLTMLPPPRLSTFTIQ